MLRKAAASLVIFLTLFAASWWVHEKKVPQTEIISPNNQEIQILEQGSRKGVMRQKVRYYHQPFQPREYIRLYKREDVHIQ